MGAFLRRHAGVIQSALYVIILLLLIVFFCAPVYEVACIFTVVVACAFRAWLSFYSCREEAREEGRTFLGWREPVFLGVLESACFAFVMLLSSLGRQFPEYGLFLCVLGIGAWGITVVLSWLGAKSRCRIEGKPFIWYYTAGIWASLFGLAVTGVMLAVSIV